MPAGVEDRNADVWEPLLAIADIAGGAWPKRAREAAVALIKVVRDEEPSLGLRLLADLRMVFGSTEEMSSKDILQALAALDEAPWADINGKPLDARGLANHLRPYGVRSITVRLGETKTPKGYKCADLLDLWRRYLPPSAESPPQAPQANPRQTQVSRRPIWRMWRIRRVLWRSISNQTTPKTATKPALCRVRMWRTFRGTEPKSRPA